MTWEDIDLGQCNNWEEEGNWGRSGVIMDDFLGEQRDWAEVGR